MSEEEETAASPDSGEPITATQDGGKSEALPMTKMATDVTPIEADPRYSEKEGDFIRFMAADRVHPVLVFGTRESGKSTMLQSLIWYATRNQGANLGIRLGKNVFPPSFPRSKERYESAVEFFNLGIEAFDSGCLPAATQKDDPFFVPIVLTVAASAPPQPSLKFAFLEAMGEWFEKNERSDATFRPLKPEITGILKRFTDPISVIFIGPCGTNGDAGALQYSHNCLCNCMREYMAVRTDKTRDNVIFLASQWDGKFRPGSMPDNFSDPNLDSVLDLLDELPFSWPCFSAMQGIGGKAMTPYSAGWIEPPRPPSETATLNNPGQYRPVFDRFNRVLWNWLYGNAKQSVGPIGTKRENLYPDVALPPPVRRRALDSLIGYLIGDQD